MPNDPSQELELCHRQLECVFQITQALREQTDVDRIIQRTLLTTLSVTNGTAGSILLYDEKKDELVFKYVTGEKASLLQGTALKPTQGIAGMVFQTGKSKLINDIAQEKDHLRNTDYRIGFVTKDMITVALKSIEAKPIGVIQILNKRTGSLSASDMRVVEIMAVLAATAIENVRFFETERLAAVSRMIGDISHDLKNMLTPVVLSAKVLKLTFEKILKTLSPEGRKPFENSVNTILHSMNESAIAIQERMKEMTNCVKGIVTEPVFENASVNEIANKVLDTLKASAEKKGVVFESYFQEDLPKTRLDSKKIYNAFYNLIDNALEATPEGGHITLRTSFQKEGVLPKGNCVVVQIQDTGPGMPQEVLEHLFTDQAISTKVGGTGFGTKIAKNVIDVHKGRIEVDSQKGKGSTFTIRLPLTGS